MTPKARLKKKCDKIWFERLLKPACEICDKEGVQVHHYYYKSSYGHLRYNKDNGISLCRGCHFVLHHQDPKKITDQIIEARGQEWHTELKLKAYNPPLDYKDTIKWIREQVEKL